MRAVSLNAVPPEAQRVSAIGRISFKRGFRNTTRLDRLYQSDSAKIRLPNVHGEMCEAVLINTAGGLTGGDNLSWDIELGNNSHAVITTQACERIYRSNKGSARTRTRVRIGAGGMLHWLPQETILFERSSLERTIDVDMAMDARLLMVESVVLGRSAMGEEIQQSHFHDRWRIRRNDQLVHAEDTELNGGPKTDYVSTALLDGAENFASLLYVGPESNEELDAMAQAVRRNFKGEAVGASAFGGKLLVRMLAPTSYELRAQLIPVINRLRGHKPLPRVWNL